MRRERTRRCDITAAVKNAVWERDGHRCIICGSYCAMPNSHYIKRSAGGLGIEENITTMCLSCHEKYDGRERAEMMPLVRDYLKSKYPELDDKKLIYKKGLHNGT